MAFNTSNRRRSALLAFALVIAAAGMLHLACTVDITQGPAGTTTTFSLAGATIGLQLGPAGVFVVEAGQTARTIADVTPFEVPPSDTPAYAAIRIRPSDVTFTPEASATVTVELSKQVRLRDKSSISSLPTRAQRALCNSFVVSVFLAEAGTPDPCATGTEIGSIGLLVENNVVQEPLLGMRLHGRPLKAFLSNGYSMCLETNATETCDLIDPDRLSGTLTIDSLQISFGPNGAVEFVLADLPEDPAETFDGPIACCFPPLPAYADFNEERTQLCEEVASRHPRWTSAEWCGDLAGVPQPEGVTCDQVSCNEDIRVCCYSSTYCHESPLEYCANGGVVARLRGAIGAVFPGGVTCQDVPRPCLEPTQACCRDDGQCINWPVGIAECPFGGTPRGEGTDCKECPCDVPCRPVAAPTDEDDVRGCCANGECNDMTPSICSTLGGQSLPKNVFCTGDDAVDCEADSLQGACCLTVDPFCTVLSKPACEGADGTFGGTGTECPCLGACCSDTGVCAMSSRDMCGDDVGLSYQGDLTSCDSNPCPAARGACCDRLGNCDLDTRDNCAAPDREYLGDTVACVPENPCGIKVGGCCGADGNCTLATEEECSGVLDVFFGVGVSCPPPGECPVVGACCLEFDGGVGCGVITEQECDTQSGLEFHAGVSCGPVDCPESSGCGDVTGTWVWPNGEVVTLSADGTATISGHPLVSQGMWSCLDPTDQPLIRITWNNGVLVDTFTLIRDGEVEILSGQGNAGGAFCATRDAGADQSFGVATSAVCPATIEADVGFFTPTIVTATLVGFVAPTASDPYHVRCDYHSNGTGDMGLHMYFRPLGVGATPAGLCGEVGGDVVYESSGYGSTVRTVSAILIFSGNVRILDPEAVVGGMVRSAAAAGVGGPCSFCP